MPKEGDRVLAEVGDSEVVGDREVVEEGGRDKEDEVARETGIKEDEEKDAGKFPRPTRVFKKPKLVNNPTELEKQIYSCKENLSNMEEELFSIEKVN